MSLFFITEKLIHKKFFVFNHRKQLFTRFEIYKTNSDKLKNLQSGDNLAIVCFSIEMSANADMHLLFAGWCSSS